MTNPYVCTTFVPNDNPWSPTNAPTTDSFACCSPRQHMTWSPTAKQTCDGEFLALRARDRKARLTALLCLVPMIDLCASANMATSTLVGRNNHCVVGEMPTVTHEISSWKRETQGPDRAPIDLYCVHCLQLLCSLTNSRLHKATALSKNCST